MRLSADRVSTGTEIVPALDAFLRKNLSPGRYSHSRNVAALCEEFCLRFGQGTDAGIIAGLGHDAARELPQKTLLREAPRDGLPLEPYEKKAPVLLHARVSALILKEKFGVDDEEVLDAVRSHTLGRPSLGVLGKILFVADYCEPARKYIDDGFRQLCFGLPLNAMVVYILDNEKARGHAPSDITQAMYDTLVHDNS